MPPAYLLDTNILEYMWNPASPEHPKVCQRIGDLPHDAPLLISVVTYGEVLYGHGVQPSPLTAALIKFMDESFPYVLGIGKDTTVAYAGLRTLLFSKYAPKPLRKKGLRPEQLADPATSRELGIQENDLWIAAQAIEHRLALVTHDRMAHIREVAKALSVEDWAS